MILGDGRFKSTSIANASRLKSSTTLKVLNRRQQNKLSLIKSMDQHWFLASGTCNVTRWRLGMRFFPRLRLFRPKSRYMRCTRL